MKISSHMKNMFTFLHNTYKLGLAWSILLASSIAVMDSLEIDIPKVMVLFINRRVCHSIPHVSNTCTPSNILNILDHE
jgi:hypothetical protein